MSEDAGRIRKIERGWCWGSKEFRQELLEEMSERKGLEHFGEEIR